MKKLTTIAATSALALIAASCSAGPTSRLLSIKGFTRFVVVEPGLSIEEIQKVAQDHCGGAPRCHMHVWDDAEKAATKFPMTDEQVESTIAVYQTNPGSGRDALIVGGVLIGKKGTAPKEVPAEVKKYIPANRGWCDGLASAYLGIKSEIHQMGLDSGLEAAATGDAFQAWQSLAKSSGCIK